MMKDSQKNMWQSRKLNAITLNNYFTQDSFIKFFSLVTGKNSDIS